MIKGAAICPHPPAIIPEVGGAQALLLKKTAAGMEGCAQEISKLQPQAFVLISPHGPMRYDKFTINLQDTLEGSFASFGGSPIKYDFKNMSSLSKSIFEHAKNSNLPIEIIRESTLDYGSLVPLHFLSAPYQQKPKIVQLTYTALDWNIHFEFGKNIGKILQQTEEPVALIASGDLSHRLIENSPAGFSPYGIKFDRTVIDLLEKNELKKIMNLNPEFCDEAGECGLRSIIMLLGMLSDTRHSFKKLSYEGPLGVGHLVGYWKVD